MFGLGKYIERHNKMKHKIKIKNVISRAESGGMVSCESGTNAQFAMSFIKNQFFPQETKNIVVIDCQISLQRYMNQIHQNKLPIEHFKNQLCGTITEKEDTYEFADVFLFEEINYAMNEQKPIYIVFSIEDYDVDNIDGVNEYSAHCTSALLIPGRHNYDCYYINPHGRDMKDTNYFKTIATNKRCRVFHYKQPMDTIFMEALCQSFKQTHGKHIQYDSSYRYNYLGANLQSGDNYGVCFVFTYIVFYNIGMYLTNMRNVFYNNQQISIESGWTLLKKGRLGYFVESMFIQFDKQYQNILCFVSIPYRTARERLERYVIKNAGNFLKSITAPMVSMITQSKVKQMIYK